MSRTVFNIILGTIFVAVLVALIVIRTRKKNSIGSRLVSIKNYEYTDGSINERQVKSGKKKGSIDSFIKSMANTVDTAAYNAGINMNASKLTIIWVMLVLLFPLLLNILGLSMAVCITATVLLVAAPPIVIFIKKKKRTAKFEEQLIDAIGIMNSAIKAGHSFQGSLQVVSRSAEDPIKREFELMFNELQLGAKLEDALHNLSTRLNSKDVDIFCTALIVQSSIGGNLIEVLENIASTIRTRLRIKKELKSKTASGRLSGIIVGILPFFLFLAIKILNPDYINPFIATRIGKLIILVGLVFMGVGVLLIRKILKIEY